MHARERGVDEVIAVGPLAVEIAAAYGEPSRSLADATEAAAVVPGLVRPGDTVLVKGSRGVGLERVAGALRAAPAGAREDPHSAAAPGR